MKSTTINEALENLKEINDIYNPCMQDAKVQSEKNDNVVAARIKEHNEEINIPEAELRAGYTGNHNKKVTSPDLKAMGLSESNKLFGYNIYLNENLVCSKSDCNSRESALGDALSMIESLAGDADYDATEDEFEYELTSTSIDEDYIADDSLFDAAVAEIQQLDNEPLN